jgi:hypothetical protein
MLQFRCDSCEAVKAPDEVWILGLAAEAVGFTAARREVNILSGWDYNNAVHPLAVHFCSESCKDHYINKLFGNSEDKVTEIERDLVRPRSRTKVRKTRRHVA